MKLYRYFSIISVTFFMALLIVKPDVYMASVSEGFKLFVISVLPAMFPFFFFNKILTSLGTAKILAKHTKKPIKYLFNAPDTGGYIFIMSVMSGYPVGAKLVSDCYENGLISEGGAKSLISFTSTSGPLFILGTIGTGLLGNYLAGVIILLSHYLGAVVNGLLFKPNKAPEAPIKPLIPDDYDNVLSEAVNTSILSALSVGGFIAIFNMAVTALNDFGIMAAVSSFFIKFNVPSFISEGFISGIIEVTRGSVILSSSKTTYGITVPLIAGLVSFGGLSVTLQSLAFLSKCKIKPSYYLLTKLSQGGVTFIIAYIICSFVF